MKYRNAKKKNQYARCLWLVDNLGTVKRSYLVSYFKKHPHDFALVKHLSKQQDYNPFYIRAVKKDIKMNYKHPDFSQESCDKTIEQIENTYFIPYIKMKKYHCNIGISLGQLFSYRLDDNFADFFKLPNDKYFNVLRREQ